MGSAPLSPFPLWGPRLRAFLMSLSVAILAQGLVVLLILRPRGGIQIFMEAAKEAKHGLQNYWFTVRNHVQQIRKEFDGDDKEKIDKVMQETLEWIDQNEFAKKDEYETKRKEVEGVVNPIIDKVYEQRRWSGSGGSGGAPIGTQAVAVMDKDKLWGIYRKTKDRRLPDGGVVDGGLMV